MEKSITAKETLRMREEERGGFIWLFSVSRRDASPVGNLQ